MARETSTPSHKCAKVPKRTRQNYPSVKLSGIGRFAIFSHPVLKVGSGQRAIGNPLFFCLLPFANCRRVENLKILILYPIRHLSLNLTLGNIKLVNGDRLQVTTQFKECESIQSLILSLIYNDF